MPFSTVAHAAQSSGRELFAGDELAGTPYQHSENLKRLPNQLHPRAVFPQLAGMQVSLISTESKPI
jgi:hypothetical protein